MTGGPEYDVYLGACDWRHPGWRGGFYPDDLPEDWLRAFYATQFSCVWLDAGQQRRADFSDQLAAWLAETPDSFRVLLEQAGADEAEAAAMPGSDRVMICSGPRAGRLIWFDRTSDLRALTERIRAALQDPPVYLLSRDNDLGMVERVKTLLDLLGL